MNFFYIVYIQGDSALLHLSQRGVLPDNCGNFFKIVNIHGDSALLHPSQRGVLPEHMFVCVFCLIFTPGMFYKQLYVFG